MAQLRTKHGCPYGGLYALDLPEKGIVGKGSNFRQLLDKITEYRKANAIPCGLGLEQEVEREICLKYPAECEHNDPRVPRTDVRITVSDVVQGSRLAFKHKLAGSELVSLEVAEARARVCKSCPWNCSVQQPCSSGLCGELKDLVQWFIGSKTTRYDDQLRNCAICRCWNSIGIWVPLKIQQDVLTEEQKEQFCYAREQVSCWKGEGL